MPGLMRRVGTPKLAMLRTPGTDTLGAASASGTQRFRLTRHFTRPNTEQFTGSIRGVTGGWNYNLQTIRAGFFDRGAVLNKLTDIQAKVYSKFGAYVRQRAMTSIRNKAASVYSAPGSPPYNHTDLLKKNIFFFWDNVLRRVIIGPSLFRTAKRAQLMVNADNNFATIPAIIEHGGTETNVKDGKPRNYAARPFMGPAFKYEYEHNLGRFWKEQRQTPFTP